MIMTALAGYFDESYPPAVLRPPAVLSTVSPATGGVAGGTVLTLTGTGFGQATGVLIGGLTGTAFAVLSPTQIRVTTPSHVAGAVTVTVQSPNGNGTKSGGFTYA